MAESTKPTPENQEAVIAAGKAALSAISDVNDLTRQLTESYKKLAKMQDDSTKRMGDALNLSKEMLRDDNIRRHIQRGLTEDIENHQRELLRAYEQRAQAMELVAMATGRDLDAAKELLKETEDTVQSHRKSIALGEREMKLLLARAGIVAYIKDTGVAAFGMFGSAFERISKFFTFIRSVPKELLLILAGIYAISKGIEYSWQRFSLLEKSAQDFREETGFTTSQLGELRRTAEKINITFQRYGVGIDAAYKVSKALTDVFGRAVIVTDTTATNIALMSANLGVAAEYSAAVLGIFQGLGGASESVAMDMIGVAAVLSKNTGVSFSAVMKDIASASGETLAMLGASPSALVKSAIAARALGTDLNKIVASQRRMLDFTTSINDELGASALLGRSISFQKARQLAYEGKVEDAAKATLETVKAAGDFNKMNVYQREALAKAAGMDLQDLTKMLAVDKRRQDILNGTDEAKKKQLLAQEKELELLKKKADLNQADLVEEGRRQIMQQEMQSKVSQIQNALKSLATSLGEVLLPIITPVVDWLVPALQGAAKHMSDFAMKIREGSETMSSLSKTALGVLGVVTAIAVAMKSFSVLKSVLGMAGGAGGNVGKMLGGSVSKGFKSLADGVSSFGTGSVLKGAAAILMVSGAIALFALGLGLFAKVDWAAAALGLLTMTGMVALFTIFGPAMAAALPAIPVLLAVGAAVTLFGAGAYLAGKGAQFFVDAFSASIDPIKRLAELDLVKTAFGITAVGYSLAAFGAGSVAAGIGAFVGNFLGGDPIKKLERLAAIGPNLMAVSDSLSGIKTALSGMETIATSVDALTESLVRFNEEMENVSTLKLAALGIMGAAAAPAPAAAPAAGTNADVVGRLDELISLMKNGGIAVNMDGKRVSSALAAGD